MNKPRSELYHLKLMRSVAEALSLLLEPGDFHASMTRALESIATAADSDRLTIFQRKAESEASEQVMSLRYEWAKDNVPTLSSLETTAISLKKFPRMLEHFESGLSHYGQTRDFSDEEGRTLESQHVLSAAFTPIILHGELWGFVRLDDCTYERSWTDEELQSLRAAAAGLGGAIVRQQVENSFKRQADELRRHQQIALSLAEDARMAEHDAAKANSAKTTFLAMMSHEIRTPLNGVLGFTDLLLADDLPPHQAEITQSIKACGESLLGLISDILDISKIESGKLELQAEAADIENCAYLVMSTLQVNAGKNNVRLQYEPPARSLPCLHLDLNRFRQILFNLIGNAIKFTRDGTVTLRLTYEPFEGDTGILHGEVSDTGTGIPEEEITQIFEPFQQGENARSSAVGGSGLGLAICRRLIEIMGGEIHATSQIGKGSTFTFHVKTCLAAPSVPAAPKPPPQTTNAEDHRLVSVLVVDDVPTNVRLCVSLLARLGFRADCARNGREAVEMASQKKYDLIFMDILMPELDGHGAARMIRSSTSEAKSKDTYIIAVTADVLPENRERCINSGMNDFLTKPLRVTEMQAAIDHWKRNTTSLHS